MLVLVLEYFSKNDPKLKQNRLTTKQISFCTHIYKHNPLLLNSSKENIKIFMKTDDCLTINR